MDPDLDFSRLLKQFDTFLVGRKTFEVMQRMGRDAKPTPGIQSIVFSRTLRPADYPHVIVSDDAERFVTELRGKPGKDIALYGGGELFRSLLKAGLVDRVEVSLIPGVVFHCSRPQPHGRNSNCESNACTRRRARSGSNTTLSELD
jgi:dihydrofolate reductase